MIPLYLITGFLGAGKTTLMKNLIRLFSSGTVHLIINEFGREGVDGALLRDRGATLSEINNGSVFCACRLETFEQELERSADLGPDVILVETSGLSDPTQILSVAHRHPRLEYQGSICVADTSRLTKTLACAQACSRQLEVSELILLNKADLVSPQRLEAAREQILAIQPHARIYITQFGAIEKQWLDGLHPIEKEPGDSSMDITLQKAWVQLQPNLTEAKLLALLERLVTGSDRIKGFVGLKEKNVLVDCTGEAVRLLPWDGEAENRLMLLAGKGMPLRKTILDAKKQDEEWIAKVEWG